MNDNYNIVIGLLFGIVAYCLLYLAKGFEKYAIEGIKKVKTLKSKHSIIWFLGLSLNAAYMFIQWVSLNYAPVSVIAPLNGIGLICLLLFSFYILKENISKVEFVGVTLVIIGTVFSSLSNPNKSIIKYEDFSLKAYLIFLIVVICIEMLITFILKQIKYKGTGAILGLIAGTFFAFETVSKRITAIPDSRIKLYFTLITMFISCIGFIFTQYALVKANANIAVPCFNSTSIVFAILIGIVFLKERYSICSIISIVLIVIGIILLTAFKESINTKLYKNNNSLGRV